MCNLLDGFLSHLKAGRPRSICVAVSGGGDSMALLLAAHEWCSAQGGPGLTALTVDHGLRAESAAEAEGVAAFCAARGIAHRTLAWEGEKPATGLSVAARDARHRLLAEAARQAKSDIVLTGHTLDDQAETVVMRAARGSGRGEAGIAPATLFEGGAWFVRPLLERHREALREFLRGRGVAWVDDPSNTDPAYERARIRRALSQSERHDAAARANVQGRRREDLGRRASAIVSSGAARAAPGLFRLEPSILRDDREASRYALRILLAAVGGRSHLAEEERAAALLEQIAAGDAFRTTLAGCVVDLSRRGLFLHREGRDLPLRPVDAAGVLWDGRFHVAAVANGDGKVVVGPAGMRGAFPDDRSALLPRRLLRAAAGAEPSVRLVGANSDEGAEFADAPVVADALCRPVVAPWARYLPSFDLAPASAVSAVLGAPQIPASPLERHIRVT